MNNVSFGGIYLHRYSSRRAMRAAYNAFNSAKAVELNVMGCNFSKAEALPVPCSSDLLVCTGKDATAFRKVIDKSYDNLKSARAALQPFAEKAKIFVHKYL